jgi:hypothetical protein
MDIDIESLINFAEYQGYRKDYATQVRDKIEKLEERNRLLTHLEAKGVDNWEGYSEPKPSQESVS